MSCHFTLEVSKVLPYYCTDVVIYVHVKFYPMITDESYLRNKWDIDIITARM
jgi:hypothetical protein